MIEERVKKVISDNLEIDISHISIDSSFRDLGADSLDAVQLIMGLEEEFNINIPDEDMDDVDTVQKAVDYIRNKQ